MYRVSFESCESCPGRCSCAPGLLAVTPERLARRLANAAKGVFGDLQRSAQPVPPLGFWMMLRQAFPQFDQQITRGGRTVSPHDTPAMAICSAQHGSNLKTRLAGRTVQLSSAFAQPCHG